MILYNVLIMFFGFVYYLFYKIKEIHGSKNRLLKIIIIFFPLIFFASVRSINIGNDTSAYHYLFTQSKNFSLSSFLINYKQRYEYGFLVLVKLTSLIFESPQSLIIISSVITLSLLCNFVYKYSDNYFISVFLFLTMRFYFFYMSNIRQSIAISIILISYTFLLEKKFYRFVITVVFASLFHSTAIIFLFVYFMPKKNFYLRTYIFLTAICILIYSRFGQVWTYLQPLFPLKYQNYINTTYFLASDNIANLLNMLIYLIVFGTIIYMSKDNKTYDKYYYIRFSFFNFLLAILSLKFGMFGRMQHYFSIFTIISIPNLLNKLKKEEYIVLLYFLLCSFIIYQNVVLYFRPEWQHVYPFEFFRKEY